MQDEDFLQRRDERVKTVLTKALERLALEKAEADARAQEASREMIRLREAADNEQWWQLRSYLSQSDIESLCNCSPSELLSED